ncbi:MAG: nucleotidyltransferase domain-containing protein [Desulfatirhabdiaceae bacterium]
MKPDNSILQTIAQRIQTVIDPEQIILFGSAASGTMTAGSDIDPLFRHSGDIGQLADNRRVRSTQQFMDIQPA